MPGSAAGRRDLDPAAAQHQPAPRPSSTTRCSTGPWTPPDNRVVEPHSHRPRMTVRGVPRSLRPPARHRSSARSPVSPAFRLSSVTYPPDVSIKVAGWPPRRPDPALDHGTAGPKSATRPQAGRIGKRGPAETGMRNQQRIRHPHRRRQCRATNDPRKSPLAHHANRSAHRANRQSRIPRVMPRNSDLRAPRQGHAGSRASWSRMPRSLPDTALIAGRPASRRSRDTVLLASHDAYPPSRDNTMHVASLNAARCVSSITRAPPTQPGATDADQPRTPKRTARTGDLGTPPKIAPRTARTASPGTPCTLRR